jgi:23S rRNA (uracil1939-C5)-methyltransferase
VVDRLQPNGEAHGTVTAVLAQPTDANLARIGGEQGAKTLQPEFVTFIGALPGEVAEVELRWRVPPPGRSRHKRRQAPQARVMAVIEPAPERVVPLCAVFGECGGCQLQHLKYPAQVAWKTGRVREALSAAGFTAPEVAPALGCDPPWGYRNHMRFSVDRDGRAGLTARGSHRVLPLVSCPIAHPRINAALAVLAEERLSRPQALVRCGDATGQMLMQPAPSPELAERLASAGLAVREDEMEEELRGVRFRIRPSSFFQTNTQQANRLAGLVLERLPHGADVTLVDAYCGVGTFARLLADQVGKVIAIEESASAIRDARWNLRDVTNVDIVQAKVEDALPRIGKRIDGLVIDPPRAGCQTPVLQALIERRVPAVVYVSCDPDTLARDLAYLCLSHSAYRLISVQPLDMFPQTAHIESVATLEAV